MLQDLGQALAAFHQDMGDRMEDIVVVTMCEFGRTAHENGNRGTDHGHANCMFVMGGDVKGGKVYGKWPGLNDHQLNEGRDLALTTDFRYVLGETLTRHIGVKDLATVFPRLRQQRATFPRPDQNLTRNPQSEKSPKPKRRVIPNPAAFPGG